MLSTTKATALFSSPNHQHQQNTAEVKSCTLYSMSITAAIFKFCSKVDIFIFVWNASNFLCHKCQFQELIPHYHSIFFLLQLLDVDFFQAHLPLKTSLLNLIYWPNTSKLPKIWKFLSTTAFLTRGLQNTRLANRNTRLRASWLLSPGRPAGPHLVLPRAQLRPTKERRGMWVMLTAMQRKKHLVLIKSGFQ